MTAIGQILLTVVWLAGALPSAGELHGRITDETGGALPGAAIEVSIESGGVQTAYSDATGEYAIRSLPRGRHRLRASLMNFAEVHRDVVIGRGVARADIVLRPTLASYVVVTAPRTFRNLAEVARPEENLLGLADSATMGAATARQIEARPAMRAAEVLEAVPGLMVTQHSGEGKAAQYYLRGFNLDHGTDFATTVAGTPVNMPTHAHGHGYSDLSFLIPELVGGVQYRKGPYFADQGDFSAAGAATITYVSRLDRPILQTSGGELGWRRALYASSLPLRDGHLLLAGELTHHDGPWTRPDDYERVNGVLRYTAGNSQNGMALTFAGYRGRWHSTDQVPRRALAGGLVDRYGGLDPTDGGSTHRYSVAVEAQRGSARSWTHGNAFALGYGVGLFSNFTYYLDDPEHGDQFEQRDARTVAGGRVVHRRLTSWFGREVETAFGTDIRHDAIGTLGLYRTTARVRRELVREDSVGQTSWGMFVQNETRWTGLLRTVTGLRVDLFHFGVASSEPASSGTEAAAILSPKASLIAGPWASTELYVNAGRGFHSNDARGTTIRIDPASSEPADRVSPLVAANGAEIGVRTIAIPRTQLTFAAWTLALDSELVFVGDAGTTDAGPASRRTGVELSVYTALMPRVHLDADLALSRARFTADGSGGVHVPGAAGIVGSAALSIVDWGRVSAGVRWRYLGARPLAEDGSVRSKPTSTVNTQLSYALTSKLRFRMDVFNALNARASDIDYFYVSRLPGEPMEGVADIHTHPIAPRAVRLALTVGF
jgi:hypothetical protein